MLDIPYTLTTHAFDIYSVENDLLPLTTTNAASVVTISNYNKQAMLEKVPHLNAEKIHVIHCGIDLSLFYKSNNLLQIQRRNRKSFQ